MSDLIRISTTDLFKTILWGFLLVISFINTVTGKKETDEKINNLEIRLSKLVSSNGYIYPSPNSSKAMTEVKILKTEVEYIKNSIGELKNVK